MLTKFVADKYLNSSFLFTVLCVQGLQYKWGDFKLRIGKCLNIPNESLRGIVMEVVTLHLLLICTTIPQLIFSSTTKLNLDGIKFHKCN